MTATMRSARVQDIADLSSLCLRSKAHWGYDAAFMDACRDELTLCSEELEESFLQVIEADGRLVGMAQLGIDGDRAEIWKLFIDPEHMGRGYGRCLMQWMQGIARSKGAQCLRIEADPGAVPFYERCGAVRVGEVPSGSISGRTLPLLTLSLTD